MSETRPGRVAVPGASRAPLPAAPRGNGDTVTVACNLPNGLVLQIFEMKEVVEQSPAGPRPENRAFPVLGQAVVINGNGLNMGDLARGMPPQHTIVGGDIGRGYGLTPGVPKELWEKWLHDNRACDYVVNGCVFAETTDERMHKRIREMEGTLSGLEPINPDRPTEKSPELRPLALPGLPRGTRMRIERDTSEER